MLPREPACPAALAIAGACASQQGVVCRIMQHDQDDDPGVDMSAGQLGTLRETEGGVYLNCKSDPSSVVGFCHGHALPVLHEDGDARASFTSCPVWQLHRERHLEGKDGSLFDPVPYEPVSMGMASSDADDPWAAARQGLDELAPVGG